jgi:porphyrinogen peroxidase
MVNSVQSGILAPVPRVGRYLHFSLAQGGDALRAALHQLCPLVDGECVVAGLGLATVAALGAQVPGLREFAALESRACSVPSTPTALWCWLRGDDQGDLVHRARRIQGALAGVFQLEQVVDGFRYGQGPNGHGRDLTGYEDGTENPQDAEAEAAALVQTGAAGLVGSSFVALQQWVHDLDAFERMGTQAQDQMVGRRRSDNEELDDAPASAHVKRTAQESFDPEAFVVRRSMPWATGQGAGLMFVAFGHSFDAFEAQMRRMAGLEDGVVDALFQMSKPVTGAYAWVPPMRDGQLDLQAVGI